MYFFSNKILNVLSKFIGRADGKRLKKIALAENVEQVKDVAYIDDGNAAHRLDFYFPKETAELLPVIVNIHGGGWIYGSKEINKPFNYYMASKGFVVANINYRLAGDADMTGMVKDCVEAIRFVMLNGSRYHADVEKLCVSGDSAGGQLACLSAAVAVCAKWQDFYGIKPLPKPIRAVGTYCGVVTESVLKSKSRLAKALKYRLFGASDGSGAEGRLTVGQLPKDIAYPPTFVSSCENDFTYNIALEFIKELQQRNIAYTTSFFDKSHAVKHVYNITYPSLPESVETNGASAEFFKRHCNF